MPLQAKISMSPEALAASMERSHQQTAGPAPPDWAGSSTNAIPNVCKHTILLQQQTYCGMGFTCMAFWVSHAMCPTHSGLPV